MSRLIKKNFKYLEDIIEDANEESPVINDLYIILSIINEFEESLLQRIHSFNREHFRFIYEVTNKFLYDHIFDLTKIDLLDSPRDIDYKTLMDDVSSISLESSSMTKFSYNDFIKTLFKNEIITYEEKQFCIDYKRKSDNVLHFVDTYNIENALDAKLINGKVIVNELNYYEAVNLLADVDTMLKIIISSFYIANLESEYIFNYSQYDDGRESFRVSKDRDKLMNFLGEPCGICFEKDYEVKGKINFPNDTTFPNGPYLQCDNSKCRSILSVNLNLKEPSNNFIMCKFCESASAKTKLTIVYNEKREIETPANYICNECKKISLN